jgi:penicillin-insensitive murein endopeptidase
MKRALIAGLALCIVLGSVEAWSAADQTPAKVLFSKVKGPALEPRSIGSYARGCLAGGTALPVNGEAWQAMRLSRNRNWGTPRLVSFLEKLATDARAAGDWPGLLVGDMSQPRGGPMPTGHASHQIGLDADIWLTPMPDRTLSADERENISAVSMLKDGVREIDPRKWSDGRARLIRRAAKFPQVARIFVHPAIKKALCDGAGTDRAWLRKVRPWWGHDAHFHVRLSCPPGLAGCKDQDEPPPGDGCGADLAYWLGPKPWEPKKPSTKPPREIMLSDLPADCTRLVEAEGMTIRADATETKTTPVPTPRERP